jgi:hypothetical protein
MYKNLKTVLSTSLVVILLSMLVVIPMPTKAVPPTDVSVINAATGNKWFNYTNVAPPPIAAGYPLGYVLANITVTNVTGLAGWSVNVTWDPTLLEIASDADLYLPTDNVFAGLSPFETGKTIDNTLGNVLYGAARGAGKADFTGSGRMCQIKFNVTKVPTVGKVYCDLVLDMVSAFATELVDKFGGQILFAAQNGYYEYQWPPPPQPPSEGAAFAVRPSEIINSSILPPQTIQINVTIENVTDMYGYGFSLSYNPTILCCISLAFFDVLGEMHYTPEFSIDNTAGIIKVNVTYYPPAVPITTLSEVSLVNMIFRVKGKGTTLLDLHDTTLVDSLGRPIPHVAHDGLFVNLIRDLAVTNVVTNVDRAYQGNPVKINVTVRNKGEVVETSISVTTHFDDDLIGTMNIPGLNPSEETTITFVWNTSDVTPCRNYTIWAEVVHVPFEIDLENNVFTDGKVKIKWMGDINGDGKVSITDVVLCINAFGSTPSLPGWDPDADVNGDGKVNIVDIVLIIKHFGEQC